MKNPFFYEEQRITQKWLHLIIFGIAALMWYGAFQQIILGIPFGNNPGPDWLVILMWLLIGIGLPIFWLRFRLILAVYDDHIVVRFPPIFTRRIPIADIYQVEVRDYRPVREYGGWGLRGGFGHGKAYNMNGNHGVQLSMKDGERILLGTQRPDDLADAIKDQM